MKEKTFSLRVRSWFRGCLTGSASSGDEDALFPTLLARLDFCASAPELGAALADAFRAHFDFRTASLYLPGPSGAYFPAEASGREEVHFRASSGLLSHLIERRIWNPEEREYHPSKEERQFTRAARIKSILPLICDRRVAGLMVLGPTGHDCALMSRDVDILKGMAAVAALSLKSLMLKQELAETRELTGMAKMTPFVIHDLKNLTHSLSLMINNAEEHMVNLAFQRDLVASLRQTVGKLNALTQRLQEMPGITSPRRQQMDIRFLCQTVVEEFRITRPRAGIVVRGEAVACLVEGEEIRKVVVNLLQNALDAIGENGLILVETGLRAGKAYLSIADTGCGMTPDFINGQLFHPFRSTKKTGMGIGLYQCRQIVESFGGSITAMSERGKGSTFCIYLPAAGHEAVPVP